MGVGTAMPALVADLGAVTLYAWPFVTFLAASVLATVLGGRWSDRSGPRAPILAGTLLFGVGLLVAGTAAAMAAAARRAACCRASARARWPWPRSC